MRHTAGVLRISAATCFTAAEMHCRHAFSDKGSGSGVVVVPDFLSTAAPTLAAVDPDGADPMLRVHDAVADLAGEGTNLWMAAVAKAEQHLLTWQEQLPFGRPLS